MGPPPLHCLAKNGSVTKQLIAARCSVDLQDKDGYTPFFITTQQGHVDIVELLINALLCELDDQA
jgi:ankyrin repeat protein